MKTWLKQSAQALAAGVALVVGVSARADDARGPHANALAEYIARPDPDFGWTERSAGRLGVTNYVELILVSQEWQGVTWKHQLYIVHPSTLNPAATHAMLVIAGHGWKEEYNRPPEHHSLSKSAPVYAQLAEKLGTPIAILLQVPFQPMFDELTEDWLIAYTFDRYLQTGDEDWPLLLPMVKSATRAMDAVQAYTRKKWGLNIGTFTVTGASKRGWTTWLTGAVDRRATAIAPMVIDVLNMAPHMKHARATWGAPSQKIEPYTKRGLLDKLDTPAGRQLLQIVDPYSYRAALDQPKLIINGTNDDYWVTDATNLYWDELIGEKHLLYVPNNNHGLRDYGRVIGSVLALHQHQAGHMPMPHFEWEFEADEGSTTVTVEAKPRPEEYRVWMTDSPIADLRKAKWTSRALSVGDGKARYKVSPTKNYQAFFVEAEFRDDRPLPLNLSTNMRVIPPAGVNTPKIAETQ
ncbi:MAG: PhoPQ-activated pathogenicity-related family protein [Opitutaceae bacterium]